MIRISIGVLWTVARRYSVGIARSSESTRARRALIRLWYTSSDGVWTLDVPWQAGALGETVVQHGTLSIRSARRRFAGVARKRARDRRRGSFVSWQTEAPHLS